MAAEPRPDLLHSISTGPPFFLYKKHFQFFRLDFCQSSFYIFKSNIEAVIVMFVEFTAEVDPTAPLRLLCRCSLQSQINLTECKNKRIFHQSTSDRKYIWPLDKRLFSSRKKQKYRLWIIGLCQTHTVASMRDIKLFVCLQKYARKYLRMFNINMQHFLIISNGKYHDA